MDGQMKALDLLIAHSLREVFAHLLAEHSLARHLPDSPTTLILQSQQVCSVAALRLLLLNPSNPGLAG